MPGRDRTGPMGAGSMSGRGLGLCTDANLIEYGAGYRMRSGPGCGLGFRGSFGRGFVMNRTTKTKKELLEEQKGILQNQLEIVEKQLENL